MFSVPPKAFYAIAALQKPTAVICCGGFVPSPPRCIRCKHLLQQATATTAGG